MAAEPGSAEFDEFVLHIDGYLCESKDAAIKDGLHILGLAPAGEALSNLVLVILRASPPPPLPSICRQFRVL